MDRRDSIKLMGFGALLPFIPKSFRSSVKRVNQGWYAAGLKKPTSVYISWAAHDEMSDNVFLTEALAMKEFDAIIKLKKQGARFDYYILDMGWFDKHEGFRAFKKEGWPNGPDAWLKACAENGIKPGLWLPTNITGWNNDPWMLTRPEWKDSAGGWLDLAMSLHSGGFLKYHIEIMQMWYDRGVRMFKFDFAGFDTATKTTAKLFTRDEIIQKNEDAWFDALKQFRLRNPEVVLLAYNGYGGESADTYPVFKKTVKLKWLEVFDSLYCGDPRPADVPCHNFWRSKDIYSDHQVFQYEFNGVPFDRVDNTAFMIGSTGTCYFRKKQAWKGMLILSAARGGWMNTYYGNLDLLDNEDGRWFAKIQDMFYPMQEFGRFSTFGEIPGTANPYGFVARSINGSLITLVNPSQSVQKIEWEEQRFTQNKLLFTDAGFKPEIEGNTITLGPEQMALVGFGVFADSKYNLGIQEDVIIPMNISKLPVEFDFSQKGRVFSSFKYSGNACLRFVFSQKTSDGRPLRLSGGAPPNGAFMGDIMKITVTQGKKNLPLIINYNKQIWSGLSWAVAEIKDADIQKDIPIEVSYVVDDPQNRDIVIDGQVYEVVYKKS
jgi:hypothetical protein